MIFKNRSSGWNFAASVPSRLSHFVAPLYVAPSPTPSNATSQRRVVNAQKVTNIMGRLLHSRTQCWFEDPWRSGTTGLRPTANHCKTIPRRCQQQVCGWMLTLEFWFFVKSSAVPAGSLSCEATFMPLKYCSQLKIINLGSDYWSLQYYFRQLLRGGWTRRLKPNNHSQKGSCTKNHLCSLCYRAFTFRSFE